MKHVIMGLLTAGLLCFAAAAAAGEDTSGTAKPSAPTAGSTSGSTSTDSSGAMSKHQTLKECMERKAAENSTMTRAERRKACKEELKPQSSQSTQSPTPQ
jgi:hypothetical protein